ncbi:hypothetical protein D3C86_1910050 [compost metagenome]
MDHLRPFRGGGLGELRVAAVQLGQLVVEAHALEGLGLELAVAVAGQLALAVAGVGVLAVGDEPLAHQAGGGLGEDFEGMIHGGKGLLVPQVFA